MKEHFIGIDISKKTLDICIYNAVHNLPENYLCIANNLTGFKQFSKWLKSKKVDFSSVVVCMEHTGIYNLDISLFLEELSIDYVAVSGLVIRRSLGFARGKTDMLDAYRISRYCYLLRDEHVYTRQKSKNLLRIRELISERRNYIKRSVQIKGYLTEYKNKKDESSLSRYKTELDLISSFVKDIEKEILSLVSADSCLQSSYTLLTSIVGVSLVNAVNIILYTNNFTSFNNARSYACYCGVAPFGRQSGTSIHSAPRVSKQCNHLLKAELSQAALSASRFDAEIRLYYQRKIAAGKHHGSVMNAIKFKLICRMFAVIKRGSPFVKLGGFAS
ncbi:transposase [Dysgonomonas sp. PFB1-18]|uniref:transposase n=1 Tax=unclassified Dysgonomonas TaxID=2630389 RepID=UPI002474B9BA|nr:MULTISPECIES: transposase [unclassified Dysgonomonas]MDH6309784.1 transposase [Dysgonomonas sp. PF1-14]MDH6339208.1 transposase [Dysgonomonas sp. PF1-16]MDH6380707.1 transposase [Dysgonomonas sp. PFB1-18]MDH6398203.1 transposase [Dysgonomonas sp. PF1-23]